MTQIRKDSAILKGIVRHLIFHAGKDNILTIYQAQRALRPFAVDDKDIKDILQELINLNCLRFIQFQGWEIIKIEESKEKTKLW